MPKSSIVFSKRAVLTVVIGLFFVGVYYAGPRVYFLNQIEGICYSGDDNVSGTATQLLKGLEACLNHADVKLEFDTGSLSATNRYELFCVNGANARLYLDDIIEAAHLEFSVSWSGRFVFREI